MSQLSPSIVRRNRVMVKVRERVRNLLSIQQCPDCGFYDRQSELLQPGQSYEVLKAASNECSNPECKSKNFASVVSEKDIEPSNIIMGKLTLISCGIP